MMRNLASKIKTPRTSLSSSKFVSVASRGFSQSFSFQKNQPRLTKTFARPALTSVQRSQVSRALPSLRPKTFKPSRSFSSRSQASLTQISFSKSVKTQTKFSNAPSHPQKSISSPSQVFGALHFGLRFFASYPPHHATPLPALSPTMTTGALVEWFKKEGEAIKPGDVIASVQTDKSTMDWVATDEGFMAKHLIAAGTENITVGGDPVCIIVENSKDIPLFKDYKVSSTQSTPTSTQSTPTSTQSTPTSTQSTPTPTQSTPTPTQSTPTQSSSTQSSSVKLIAGMPPPISEFPERLLASPLAKSLANQFGLDLTAVKGSGPGGRIVAADLSKISASKPKEAPKVVEKQGASYVDIPNSQIRKTTARRLTESKQTIPHYYLSIDCKIDELLKTRQYLNQKATNGSYKLSVNDFVIKAAAFALKEVPECNSHWMDSFIRRYSNVDINVAVNTDAGLFIPVVSGADQLGLAGISQAVKTGAEKARAGSLKPQEMEGTFTISNLGMFGIKNFAAVINPPQSCILAVGGSEERVISSPSGFVSATFMSVTLSCDHRVVDGAVGARWLQSFKSYIEDPLKLLL